MSLNDIQLSGEMMSDLYGKVLVATDKGQSMPLQTGRPASNSATPSAGLRYLGKNRRNYCFVVEYKSEPFMPDPVMETLTRILQACRLSMEDIAVVNAGQAGITIEAIRAELSPSRLVLLGVQPAHIQLPIQFPPYHPQPYAGCTFLLSDPLHDMDNSAEGRKLKTSLWNCLKEMFEV